MPVSKQKPRVVLGMFCFTLSCSFVLVFFIFSDTQRQFRASSSICQGTARKHTLVAEARGAHFRSSVSSQQFLHPE